MPKQFTVKDPSGEELVVFIEHGQFDATTSQLGGRNRLPGLRTEDGRYVNYIKRGEYEIVDDDGKIPVFSADPSAP